MSSEKCFIHHVKGIFDLIRASTKKQNCSNILLYNTTYNYKKAIEVLFLIKEPYYQGVKSFLVMEFDGSAP